MKSMTVKNFDVNYPESRKHEMRIVQAWPNSFELLTGEHGDIRNRKTGEVIEVKNETRFSLSGTPNYFVERWSSREDWKPGGPWKAQADGCGVWCVHWVQDGVVQMFAVDWFLRRTEEYMGGHRTKLRLIPNNGGYNTGGFLIPREWYTGAQPYMEGSLLTREMRLVTPSGR